MKLAQLKEALTPNDYDTIEKMAAANHGPRDIAKSLRYSVRAFLHLWKDPSSDVRAAYDRGVLHVETLKNIALMDKATSGDITAVQIHDNHAAAQRFEDIKNRIFNAEKEYE